MVDLFGGVCQKMLMSEFSWNNSLVSRRLGQCGFAFAFALALCVRDWSMSCRPNILQRKLSTYDSIGDGRDVLLWNSSFRSPPGGIQTSCPGLSCSFYASWTSLSPHHRLRHLHYYRQNRLCRAGDLSRLLVRGKQNAEDPRNRLSSPSYLSTVSESSQSRTRALRALTVFEPSSPDGQMQSQAVMVAKRRCASNARVNRRGRVAWSGESSRVSFPQGSRAVAVLVNKW